MVVLKLFFEKADFEEFQQITKNPANLTSMLRV